MRIFQGMTLEEVDDLPASFAQWALAWDSTEKKAKAELEQAAYDKAR